MDEYYEGDLYDDIYDAYDNQPDDYGMDPDLADYIQRDAFDDEDSNEAGTYPGDENFFDHRDDEEDAIQRGEDLAFAPDYRLLTAQAPTAASGIMRRLRSPLEVAIDQIRTMVFTEEVSDDRARVIVESLETVPNLPRYNIGLMIVATQYFLDSYNLDSRGFNKFLKNLGGKIYVPKDRKGNDITINRLDLIRYLTILEEKR